MAGCCDCSAAVGSKHADAGAGSPNQAPHTDQLVIAPSALVSFRRLLQSDSVCAAVLQHVRRTAPALLQPPADAEEQQHEDADAGPLTTAPSFSSRPLQQESEEEKQRRMDQLHEQALVPGVIALVLSFLFARERLQAGSVSRDWYRALQQPSLWRHVGWRCICFPFGCPAILPPGHYDDCSWRLLPPWLLGSLGRLDCDPQRLLSRSGLRDVAALTGVHDIWLKRLFAAESADHGDNPPQPVSADEVRRALQPMRLLSFRLAGRDPDVEGLLSDALMGPADLEQSASARSAATPLLEHWAPTLTDLHFDEWTLSQARPTGLLQYASGLHWPALRSLRIDFWGHYRCVPSVPGSLSDLLSRMPQLQTLQLSSLKGGPELTAALRAALPQLGGLTELHINFPLQLRDGQPTGRPGFHPLPALRVLRLSADVLTSLSASFVLSLALAPRLEVLHTLFNFVPLFLKHLEARCTGAAQSSGGNAPVLLRQLHIEGGELGVKDLRVLSRLPHLERLDCRIDPSAIAALGTFRPLRSLILPACGSWKDEHYRQLGELPLPRLEKLELRSVGPHVTVTGGLRHLLQLSALTRLRRPPLHADSLPLLRLMADAAGHRELCIEAWNHAWPTFPLFEP